MTAKAKTKTEAKAKAKVGYDAIRDEASKPQSERQAVVPGRSGLVIPRRYGMTKKAAEKMRAETRKSGTFVNPHRVTGLYGVAVQSLIDLGIDEAHSLSDVRAQMIKLLKGIEKVVDGVTTNAWERFRDRKPVNPDTGKDVNGRIIQNFQVLQRITGNHPYGEKLRQVLACIDILVDAKGLPMFMLHTGFANCNVVKPLNDMKRKPKVKAPKAPKVKAKKVTAKPKAKVKAKAKAKKVTKKAKVKVTTPVDTAESVPAESVPESVSVV